MKKLFASILVFALVLSITACGAQPSSNNSAAEASTVSTALSPYNASECAGKDHAEIEANFSNAGFTNVTSETVEDLKSTEADMVGTVISVSVSENTEFSQGQEFGKNDRVVVTYHAFKKCNVTMHIDFTENLLFSKYDVRLEQDGISQGTLEHGTDKDFDFTLDPGEYTFTFEEVGDSSVNGSTVLDVKGDIDLSLKITCHSTEITVETLYIEDMGAVGDNEVMFPADCLEYKGKQFEEYSESLKNSGFTNITLVPIYDLTSESNGVGEIEDVTVGEATNFDRGSIFANDAAIVIRYHANEADDPVKQAQAAADAALELLLPQEMARRAVVVAMTNCQATDVFSSDGNSYDITKFHSYNDIDGFFMVVNLDGNWSALDDSTWHVENIILKFFDYGLYLKVSCNVSMDGSNYIISNVDRAIGTIENIYSQDPSRLSSEHFEPSESNPFLTVPVEMIENDRDDAALQEKIDEKLALENAKKAHDDWVNGQFSIWSGSHKALESLIKDQLNDEKSYKHIETTYVSVDSEDQKTEINKILADAGYSPRVDIDDLFIITEFSAKNYFNATIKKTAYGIADYSTDEIILVAIE